jgi:putative FmdB family regulatory protein
MPKYEYACKSCGEHIDVVQSFTDDALTECPTCGGPLRKVFGSVGIVLKGPGFYRNDHRSPPRSEGSKLAVHDKEKKGEKADVSSGSEGAAASSSSTERSSASTGSSCDSSSSPSSSGASSTGGPKDAAKTA